MRFLEIKHNEKRKKAQVISSRQEEILQGGVSMPLDGVPSQPLELLVKP